MAQNQEMKVRFFASGYCEAHARITDPKNGRGKIRFYAVWAFIEHPQLGNIVFDTGYHPRFFSATRKFPDRLYRWATPVTLEKKESAVEILNELGIDPNEINYVIISHFHGDHICGLKDFPNAEFICSREAYAQLKELSGFFAVKKGILKELIPEDFDGRVKLIEDISTPIKHESGLTLFRFFNLPEIQLVLLPGHARGMLGGIFNLEHQHLFFATDASWSYETFNSRILPRKMVTLFFDSWNDFIETQEKLRSYENMHPEVKVLFTHCPLTLQYLSESV